MNAKIVGMSITEIMIALVISSILMYGVVTIMVSSKRTYALQDELAKLQDNARFVMEEFMFSLRMAGYQGCVPDFSDTSSPLGGENDQEISVGESGSSTLGDAFPVSDTLIISSIGTPLQWPAGEYSPDFLKANPINLHPDSILPSAGQEVTVGDCNTRKKYTVSEVDPKVPSLKLMGFGGIVFRRPIDIFLVNNSTLTYTVRADDMLGKGLALYKNGERFIEGVENLQVRYGVVIGDGFQYQDTPPGTGANIRSVRITLLMRTAQPRFDIQGATDKEYILDPEVEPYNPNNNPSEQGYRHRLFTTVVAIRNANL